MVRGLDELLLAQRHDQRAHNPRGIEPAEEADHDRERQHARLEQAVDRVAGEPRRDSLAERDHEQQQRE